MPISSRNRRFRQAVLALAPAGYWPLDEASGTTATDISGNGRHGTYTSTVTPGGTVSPLGGPAALFAGGYIVISDDNVFTATSTGQTLVALTRADASPSDRMWIITKGGSGGVYEWGLSLGGVPSPYTVTGDLWTGAGGTIAQSRYDSPIAYRANQWHLWICRYPGITTTDFPVVSLNGVQLPSPAQSSTGSGVTNSNNVVLIGERNDSAETPWAGPIVEVAYIARDIGATAATNLYRAYAASVPAQRRLRAA